MALTYTELLDKDNTSAVSPSFTLGPDETARLSVTGGSIMNTGVIFVEMKVGTADTDWEAAWRMEAPANRVIDVVGPGEFRIRRNDRYTNSQKLGVVLIKDE